MLRLLIIAGILAAGFYFVSQNSGPAGIRLSTGSSSSGGFTGATRSVTGAVAGAAARGSN